MSVSYPATAEEVQVKRCPGCGELLPRASFHRCVSHRDGLAARCKDCTSARQKQYRDEYREAIRSRKATYQRANREKINARERASRATDPEKALARKLRYRAAHPEKVAAADQRQYAKWEAENYERRLEINARRRARLRGATVGRVDYAAILERDGYWCYLCQAPVEPNDVSMDHVIPLSKGGAHSMENIKVSHLSCNLRKYNKVMN